MILHIGVVRLRLTSMCKTTTFQRDTTINHMPGLANQYSYNIWSSNHVSQLEFNNLINWESCNLILQIEQ